ncbi:MAG: methylthioribulose 1-phosphate dehydratase [Flavobacteriales bacterium]
MDQHDWLLDLTHCIRELNLGGHSPATSTNYSQKDCHGTLWVSRSGIDKGSIEPKDFLRISNQGIPLSPHQDRIPSAETGIHCALYEWFPETQVVLHSHSIWPLLLAHSKTSLCFEGYELQKAFPGIDTHECSLCIPVIPNSQDMEEIKTHLHSVIDGLAFNVFMIDKHGFYTWGSTLFEAKRILEAFTYLCQCEWQLKK